MLLDANATFSDDQDFTGVGAGNTLSDKSYDLGVAGTDALGNTVIKDFGRGTKPALLCEVTTAFTSAGAATMQVQLVMADDAALGTNLTVLQQTDLIAKAALVAGYQFDLAIPAGIKQRFLGLRYATGTAAWTAGKIKAAIVETKQTNPFVG